MKLQTKLLASKICLATIPVVLVSVIVLWQANSGFDATVGEARTGLTATNEFGRDAVVDQSMAVLTNMAQDVYAMCQAQQELLQEKTNYDLKVAHSVLDRYGPVTFGDEHQAWTAINQYTSERQTVELPKMLVGQTWLGQNADPAIASPLVDDVENLVGSTCTVFQRMNEAGDMLRVSTNVKKLDNTRAIGTYIPAVNPNGNPNPVVSTVLKGETFRGRAYVVNAWYITAYEPIIDSSGNVTGVLYVGVPEQQNSSLRHAIMDRKIGDSGYVFVLNAKGNTKGHYVISRDGLRDNEDLWDAKDNEGKPFIQNMCAIAANLKPFEIGETRYSWQNKDEDTARDKIVRIAYFEPWDWLIGVSVYEDELLRPVIEMEQRMASRSEKVLGSIIATGDRATATVANWCLGIGGATLVIAVFLAIFISRSITKPINRVITEVNEGADQVNEASRQVSAASQQLAHGASEQAASLEETSSALASMAEMTRSNAQNAQEANSLSNQARNAAESGNETMAELNKAMTGINEASGQISNIIKVIEEIAFQTNLLALNAAVEAARAGEHGKGFAVVADEVRNLAQRAGQAARETTVLIEDSVTRAREGAEVASLVNDALGAIVNNVTQATDLVNKIATASNEQANGVEQVNRAVAQMDSVTQQNAANAEESASAAEQLSAQSETVKTMVHDLSVMISGD